MSPTAPVMLGVALGMRHALDADHIVAMSTIVARERSMARAALLGAAWQIVLFGAGAIGGMMAITTALALPARFGAGARRGATWISAAAGVASVLFGMLYLTVWA